LQGVETNCNTLYADILSRREASII